MYGAKYFIFIFCFFGWNLIHAQSWTTVGSPGFSAGSVSNTSVAIGGSGTPYVVYRDSANGNKATVMKYDGSNWVTVGSPGFSTGIVEYPSIAIDRSGTPYVAYQDDAIIYSGATVMKFNGSDWVNVGNPGFAGIAEYISIAIAPNGLPYVAYRDFVYGYLATVMRFNGSSWETVGMPGFSGDWEVFYTSIAIDEDGTPYVIFQDNSNSISFQATVMKYIDSNWVVVGYRGISSGEARYTSIAISGSIPYVVFQDFGDLGKATVLSYQDSAWNAVGNVGFSAGAAFYTTIAIDKNGTPYVAYEDVTNTSGTGPSTVMKYNGSSWTTVGSEGFSAGVANYTSINIDSNGTPYVAYLDYANSEKATVMKFDATTGVNTAYRSAEAIAISPNPNEGSFRLLVSSPTNEHAQVAITNILGEKVIECTVSTNKESAIDLDVAAGMYFLTAVTGEGVVSGKVVVR